MSTKFGALAFTVALASPFAAFAQDYSGALTLGYSETGWDSVYSVPTKTVTFDGRIKFAFENGLTFGARFNKLDKEDGYSETSTPGDLKSFDLGYTFSNNMKAAAFYESFSLDYEDEGDVEKDYSTMDTTGIEIGYEADGIDVAVFAAKSKMGGPGGDVGSDYSLRSSGIRASYSIGEKLTIGVSVVKTDWDIFGSDLKQMTTKGIAAVYSATDKINIFAGLVELTGAESIMWRTDTYQDRTISLGASYDLTDNIGVPMIASLELARSSSSVHSGYGTEAVRFGLSIPLGKGKIKAPLNSTADAILNPSRSAFSQAHLSF
ncbi:hypothetical protein Q9295_05170 [Xinfangfangia sp. CPCC 101601]|uniref:Porin n=1 Tax=Pseudogemmobacter lacusdianii TaxID=3069608 RepID=A0ABU0VVH2_9RHOB|nr:hypothetical protein [Xinfangfangia sp. CPCC 101601]MDQ2065752.1 hypothetical protein [Xinfangfangia sp. CPCC 101601]